LSEANGGFGISHDPAASSADPAGDSWLELIANGLTFDVTGLAPGQPAGVPPQGHGYGLPPGFDGGRLEAITLQLGPHLAEGATMLPVVRTLAWLTARLAGLQNVRAVAWHSARCWSSPEHFRDSVLRWTEGGVFPGLGLAALMPAPDGSMQSEGLALFTGQEVRLEPELVEDRAAAARTALRLLHWLVEHGRLAEQETITGPDGEPLRLEPSANGRFVRVWRG